MANNPVQATHSTAHTLGACHDMHENRTLKGENMTQVVSSKNGKGQNQPIPENHAEKGMVQNGQEQPIRVQALDRASMIDLLMGLQRRDTEKSLNDFVASMKEKVSHMSDSQKAQYQTVYWEQLKSVQLRDKQRSYSPAKTASVKDLATQEAFDYVSKLLASSATDTIDSLMTGIAAPINSKNLVGTMILSVVASIPRNAVVIKAECQYRTHKGSVEKGDFAHVVKKLQVYLLGLNQEGAWTFDQCSKDNHAQALERAFSQSRIDMLEQRCKSGQAHKVTIKNREYLRAFGPEIFETYFTQEGQPKKNT